MPLLPLGQVAIGEPDANSEYFLAQKNKSRPIFEDCHYTMPQFPTEDFVSGAKYMLYGQKGTGKTALLRSIRKAIISKDPKQKTEFIIFKNSVLEDVDLQSFHHVTGIIDEDAIKRTTHYQHALKRLILFIILSKMYEASQPDDDSSLDGGLLDYAKKLINSSAGDAIRLAFDSISTLFASVGLKEGAVPASVKVDAAKLLKRNNDDLTTFACRQAKRRDSSIKIFFDEIHFAYRNEQSLQNDAMVVRDLILAAHSLNTRFADEQLDISIYLAIRSEFLEHPIIATADVNHVVDSVGYNITWAEYPYTKIHPLFDLMSLRLGRSQGAARSSNICLMYLANIRPEDFLGYTWSKPRDIIRFFKCAQILFPKLTTLTRSQINTVLANYAQRSWAEVQAASAAFLPPAGIAKLNAVLGELAPGIYDGSTILDIPLFAEKLRPVYEIARTDQSSFHDYPHFLRLIYILGIFGTRRIDAANQSIYYSYHRGNRNYHHDGRVMIHPAVLRAFG